MLTHAIDCLGQQCQSQASPSSRVSTSWYSCPVYGSLILVAGNSMIPTAGHRQSIRLRIECLLWRQYSSQSADIWRIPRRLSGRLKWRKVTFFRRLATRFSRAGHPSGRKRLSSKSFGTDNPFFAHMIDSYYQWPSAQSKWVCHDTESLKSDCPQAILRRNLEPIFGNSVSKPKTNTFQFYIIHLNILFVNMSLKSTPHGKEEMSYLSLSVKNFEYNDNNRDKIDNWQEDDDSPEFFWWNKTQKNSRKKTHWSEKSQ